MNISYNNAAYLPFGWFIYKQDEKYLISNIQRMKSQNVMYALCNLGTINELGKLDGTFIRDMNQYIKLARKNYPEQKILAWINGETDKLTINKDVYNLVADTISNLLETFDIDGIHFDIEPLKVDNDNLLSFMRVMRIKTGKKLLSIAASNDNWSYNFIREMGNIVDILLPMIYDSEKITISSYQKYVYDSSIVWLKSGLKVIPTLPAYSKNSFHYPSIENISSCFSALQKSMNEMKRNFHGFATWNWYEMNNMDNILFMNNCIKPNLDAINIVYNNIEVSKIITAKLFLDNQWISVGLTGVFGLYDAKINIFLDDRSILFSYPSDRNWTVLNSNGNENSDYFSFKLDKISKKKSTGLSIEIITTNRTIYLDGIKLKIS